MENNSYDKTSIERGENESIGCKVEECLFHADKDNYCTLPKIEVVKHEDKADTIECTDCGSFVKSK